MSAAADWHGPLGMGGAPLGNLFAPVAEADAAELAALGPPARTCPPARLTEEETEYAVTLTKHLWPGAVVLAFEVANTVAEQVLEDVAVVVEVDADGAFVQEAALPAPGALAHGSPGTAYVLLRALDAGEDAPLPTASLPATLRFKVKEIDPASGEVRAGRASVGGWAVRPKRCSSTPHAPRPCQSVSPRFPTPSRSTRPSPLLPPPPHHPLHPSGRGGGIRR